MAGKFKMDNDTKKKLDEFHAVAATAAEEVLFKTFPSKIIELQELIQSTNFPSSPFHISHAATTTDATVYPPPSNDAPLNEPELKKRKLEDGATTNGTLTKGNGITLGNSSDNARFPDLVLANKHLATIYEIMKKECEQLAESIDKVKLWVNLSMPKIEDGDNFGVQIQEEVLNELHRSQESVYNLRDAARQSYFSRGKLCSKIIKYPHVEDYTLALREHDEKQIYVARQNLYDLRNIYAILTDILHKNLNKIRSPKGNNSSGLY